MYVYLEKYIRRQINRQYFNINNNNNNSNIILLTIT